MCYKIVQPRHFSLYKVTDLSRSPRARVMVIHKSLTLSILCAEETDGDD